MDAANRCIPNINLNIRDSCNSDCKDSCCCLPFMRLFRRGRQVNVVEVTAQKVDHTYHHAHHHESHHEHHKVRKKKEALDPST